MARPLVFQFGDHDIAFELEKIDRSKLYGYKEVEAITEEGDRCDLATLAADGHTIIGRGGTGFGYLSADGEWNEKADLTPIDPAGNPIEPIPSSYSAPVKLFDTVTPEEYLSHTIRSIYIATSDDDLTDLRSEFDRGTIFSFPYSFRGGLEADAGFLLTGEDGTIFLAVGSPTDVEFIGIQPSLAAVDDTAEDEDEDSMDFDLM